MKMLSLSDIQPPCYKLVRTLKNHREPVVGKLRTDEDASDDADRRVMSAARDLKRATGRIDLMVGIAALILVGGILALRGEPPGVIFASGSAGAVPVSVPSDEAADALVRGDAGAPAKAGDVIPTVSSGP